MSTKRATTEAIKFPGMGMTLQGGEALIFEKSRVGARGVGLREQSSELASQKLDFSLSDEEVCLPEVSEFDVVRHFTRLSRLNASLDVHTYPLGSCTMKYNPRVNEAAVRLPGFSKLHPKTPKEFAPGASKVMEMLGSALLEVTGQPGMTFAPAAGAHGELAGMMMIKKALQASGRPNATILIPESAHGTNPATCTMMGLPTRSIRAGERGYIEIEDLKAKMDESVGGIMITNPNTLGIFETNIEEICSIIHDAGGFVYMDGANLNALLCKGRAGDFGVDALHINLHKTFSQPHGGGGPGAGPVVVSDRLKAYLPPPYITTEEGLVFDSGPESVGRMREFDGNFGVFVRSLSYILRLGGEGLKAVTEGAVLNANYVRSRLQEHYSLAYDADHLHEAVFSDETQKKMGVSALDIAKRLLDYGFHPPTIYFPLTVKGAIMIEPTESEPRDALDSFCDVMVAIAEEAKEQPEVFKEAPYSVPSRRLNETKAAREPVVRYKKQ